MSHCIIYLEGISLSCYDSIEDQFDTKLMEEASIYDREEEPVEYDRIPHSVESLHDLPQKTNLPCWFCDFTFSSPPVYIPIYIRNEGEMGLKGNFCSVSCASSYDSFFEGGAYYYNIVKYAQLVLGKRFTTLPRSPLKTMMRKYGGLMSETEYLAILKRINEMMSEPCYSKEIVAENFIPMYRYGLSSQCIEG